MDVQPHPTSPKYRADPGPVVAKVWNDQRLTQPRRLPWFGIILLIIVLNLVATAGFVVGWGWLERNAPHFRFLHWLPLASNTTLIQEVKSPNPTEVPTPVKKAMASIIGLAPDQGPSGIYSQELITHLAAPLSSNGWMMTLTEALPSTGEVAVILPNAPTTVSQTIADPASPVSFVKVEHLDQSPVTIASEPMQTGQRIWVVTGSRNTPTAVSRIVVGQGGPRWRSSDRQENYWQLDAPVVTQLGAAVLTTDGQLVGLAGANGRVWPVDGLDAVISSVLQRASISRPSFGFRFLMLSDAIVVNEPNIGAAVIGADTGDQAVTPKSPADKAGMKIGDRVVTVDDHDLQADLQRVLRTYHPGDHLRLGVNRRGQTVQLDIIVGSLPQ